MDAASILVRHSGSLMIAFGIIMLITYAIIINLWMELSYLKKRYRKLIYSVEDGNLEQLIADHLDLIDRYSDEKKSLQKELDRLDDKLTKAITKVSVVRFDAFDNTGNDLSYCVAMLDSENNGVVISGIVGREEARTYVKPIEEGESSYKLTREEEQAVRDAMRK